MWALYIACALALLGELVIDRYAEVGADGYFGFYGVYALIVSVILVLAAKLLRKLVTRPEGYYDV